MASNQRFPRKPPYPPLPTEIFLDDPPHLSPTAAASAARITAHAERYLRGEQLYIHCARLRGPFITNPWAEKPAAKACVATKSTKSKTAKSVVIAETPLRGTRTTAVHHSIGTSRRIQTEASDRGDEDSHIEFSIHLTARRRSSRTAQDTTASTTPTPALPASSAKRTKRKRVPLRLASPDRHHNIPLSVYSSPAASEPKRVASAPVVAKEKEKENKCRRKRVRVDFDALSPAIVGERRLGVKAKLLQGTAMEPISPPRMMVEQTLDPISPPRTVAEKEGGTITLSQRPPDDEVLQSPKKLEPPAPPPQRTESQLKAAEGIRESAVVSFIAEHANEPAPEPTTTPLPLPKTPHQSTQSALLSAQRKFFEAMADSPLDTPRHDTEDSFLLPAVPALSARDTPVLPPSKLSTTNIGAGVYSDSFLESSDDDDVELRDVRSSRKIPTYTQFTPFTKPRWSNASPSPPRHEENELRQAQQKKKPRWSDPSPSPSPPRERDREQEQSFGPPQYASTGIGAPSNGTPAQSTPAPSARIEVMTTPLPPPRVDVAETPHPPAPFPAEIVPITPAAFPGTSSTIIDSVIETPPLPSHSSTHGRPQPSTSTLSRFEQPDTSTSTSPLHLNSTCPDAQHTFAAANETSTFPDAQNPNITPYEPTPFYRFSSPPAEESGGDANDLVKEVAGFMKDDWDDAGLGGFGGGEEGDSTVSILSTPGGGWGASAKRSQRGGGNGKVGVKRGLWG